jgi:TolA-binding protein
MIKMNSFLAQKGFFVFLMTILCLLSAMADTSKPITVMIVPFVNATTQDQYDPLQEGFTYLLMDHLSSCCKELRVVDRQSLKNVQKELALQKSGLMAEEETLQVGKLLGTSWVIAGAFTFQKETFHIDIRIIDVETSRIHSSHHVQVPLTELAQSGQLLASPLEQALNFKIRENLTLLPTDSQQEANFFFMNGLGHYYANFFNHAVSDFMEVLERNPDCPEARYWMGKSYFSEGAMSHSAIELKRFLKEYPSHPLAPKAKELLHNAKSKK